MIGFDTIQNGAISPAVLPANSGPDSTILPRCQQIIICPNRPLATDRLAESKVFPVPLKSQFALGHCSGNNTTHGSYRRAAIIRQRSGDNTPSATQKTGGPPAIIRQNPVFPTARPHIIKFTRQTHVNEKDRRSRYKQVGNSMTRRNVRSAQRMFPVAASFDRRRFIWIDRNIKDIRAD